MAAPNTTRSGVGFRHCTIFALNTSGLPNAPAATVYEGLVIGGVKRLTINDPEPQQISHMGDDRVFALDSLPPTEALTGELVVGKISDAIDAAITGQLSFTVGEAKLFGIGTDKRGFEQQIGMLVYRQTLDTTPGAQQLRRWEFRIFPVLLAIPREGSMDEKAEERMYTLRPQIATKHLWGTAFAVGTEGFTESQMLRGVSEYKPKIVAFKGDGAEDEFLFPATAQAVSTGKIVVWNNGVEVTSGLTKAVTGLTFTAAPATGNIIVALYETA
jgi:hypothetical protein